MARSRASGMIFPVVQGFGEPEEASDYRPVPASDTGKGYSDRGGLGSWSANGGRPYDPPAEITFYAGEGASVEDMRRGYMKPAMREDPAYDLQNYKERWTAPKQSETDQGATEYTESDWEFQRRNKRSKGFFNRPHIPTER